MNLVGFVLLSLWLWSPSIVSPSFSLVVYGFLPTLSWLRLSSRAIHSTFRFRCFIPTLSCLFHPTFPSHPYRFPASTRTVLPKFPFSPSAFDFELCARRPTFFCLLSRLQPRRASFAYRFQTVRFAPRSIVRCASSDFNLSIPCRHGVVRHSFGVSPDRPAQRSVARWAVVCLTPFL